MLFVCVCNASLRMLPTDQLSRKDLDIMGQPQTCEDEEDLMYEWWLFVDQTLAWPGSTKFFIFSNEKKSDTKYSDRIVNKQAATNPLIMGH